MTIAVAPTAQGRGWGRRLMDHLVADARDSGAEHLMLEVRADNAPAQRLYATTGFVTLTTQTLVLPTRRTSTRTSCGWT